MANPGSIDAIPAVLEATTSERTVSLDADRSYTLAHDGETTAGASATTTIYLAFSGSVTASSDSGADKFKLKDGRVVVVGPGILVLKFKTASGSPTFSVSPGPKEYGHY